MTTAWSPLPATVADLARVRSQCPDPTWVATPLSREALDSFALSTRAAGEASTVTVTAAAHNALVAQLATLHDQIAAPGVSFRVLSRDPRVPVVGLAAVAPVPGLSEADELARQRELATLRGALGALRDYQVIATGVPAGAFPWPLVLGAAVVVVVAGIGAFAAYRANVETVKLVEQGKTARAALHANAGAQAFRDRLDVFTRTGRMPPASPLETPTPEVQNTTRNWADSASEAVSRATSAVVFGVVGVTALAGTAWVLSSLLGGRRRRYVEL